MSRGTFTIVEMKQHTGWDQWPDPVTTMGDSSPASAENRTASPDNHYASTHGVTVKWTILWLMACRILLMPLPGAAMDQQHTKQNGPDQTYDQEESDRDTQGKVTVDMYQLFQK